MSDIKSRVGESLKFKDVPFVIADSRRKHLNQVIYFTLII